MLPDPLIECSGERVTVDAGRRVPIRQELNIASLAVRALHSLVAGGYDGFVLVSRSAHIHQHPAMWLLKRCGFSCRAAETNLHVKLPLGAADPHAACTAVQ
jgi:hypothetical protein